MSPESRRLVNGVKARMDGQGDDFAMTHRGMQRDLYFTDVDACIELWGELDIDGEDRHFFEYCIAERGRLVETAVVAWFDRKRPRADKCLADESIMRSRHRFMGLCRDLGQVYPVRPRFFWVCGSSGPWDVLEWDVATGRHKPMLHVHHDNIGRIWRESLEIFKDRDAMLKWLRGGKL
jgi:hypothetical protein